MILVVDDNPSIREMLKAVLESKNHAVRCAESGEDALVLMEGTPPDLVLLDLTMPGMSGIQTFKQMRDRFPNDDIPVIFVSAWPPEEEKEHVMDMGARGYISKPFDISELLQCVRTHLPTTSQANA